MFLVSTLLLFNIISYAKRSDTDDLKYFSSYPGFSVRGNSRQWEKILTEIRISISCSYMVQCDILKERKQTKNPWKLVRLQMLHYYNFNVTYFRNFFFFILYIAISEKKVLVIVTVQTRSSSLVNTYNRQTYSNKYRRKRRVPFYLLLLPLRLFVVYVSSKM